VTGEYSVRAATPGDAEFMLELFARDTVRPYTHGPRSIEDFHRSLEIPGKEVAVLERGGKPFGNICLGTSSSWMVELQVIAMLESGRGAGRFGMQYVMWRAFDDLRVNRIYLEVVAANARARTLYERSGFTPEGLFRSGYCDEDGTFHDLAAYGMLAGDPR
jgi:ribosomal protein S18 acetylase RimI-like enzyme